MRLTCRLTCHRDALLQSQGGEGWNLPFVNFVGFYFRSWSIMAGNSLPVLCFVVLLVNSAGKLPEMCPRKKRISNFLAERPRETGSVPIFPRPIPEMGTAPRFSWRIFRSFFRGSARDHVISWENFSSPFIYMYDIQWINISRAIFFFFSFTLDTSEIIMKDLFRIYWNFLRNWFYEIEKFLCEAKYDTLRRSYHVWNFKEIIYLHIYRRKRKNLSDTTIKSVFREMGELIFTFKDFIIKKDKKIAAIIV